MKKFTKVTLALASIATISGCTVMKQNEAVADAALKKTETTYQEMQIKKPDSFVSHSSEVYLAGNAFKIEKKQILPEFFHKNLTYTTAANETLQQTITNISHMVGVNVEFTADLTKVASSPIGASTGLKSYRGSLKKIVTDLASKAGLFWSYENNTIKIFSVETKVYSLDAPIGSYNLANNITSSANTGSSGSGATTNGTSSVSMNYSTKTASPWDSAVTTIKSMLSATGRLDTNPVEGYVTVTDNPERQREINQYIKKINDKTNKKIAIRVDVYDVQTDDNTNHGFNINAVIKALGGSVSWVSNAQNAIQATAGNLSQLTFKENDNSNNAVLQALNSIGKTTQMTGTTVYTISGQPAPIQNATQQNYLQSMSSTASTTQGIAPTVTLTPGTITTGYSMTVTPRIESTNEILIALNLQISTLIDLKTLSVGTGDNLQQIQLPNIHTKSFLENMILKSGQTILIAGFQDDLAKTNTSSVGNPDYWALGGSKYTQHTKSTTVVVLTPYIIGR